MLRRTFLSLIFLLVATQAAYADVAVAGSVSSGRRTGSSTTVLTISHTATGDPMLVAVCSQTATNAITSVVFNTSENLVDAASVAQTGRISWFIIYVPTATTADVVITPAVNSSLAATIWNLSGFGGLRQWDTEANGGGGATNFTLNAWGGDPGGMILDASCSDGNNQVFTAAGSQTVDVAQDSQADTSAKMSAGHLTGSSEASTTMGYTWSVSDIGTSAIIRVTASGFIPGSAPSMLGSVGFATNLNTSNSTVTIRHNVRPQDNYLLVVCTTTNGDTTFTSVTFNGDSLTEDAESARVSINHLSTPDVGTFLIVATASQTGRLLNCNSWSLRTDGLRNSARFDSFNRTSDVASVSTDIVLDYWVGDTANNTAQSSTAGANQTEIYGSSVLGNEQPAQSMYTSYETATTTTTTMSWTFSPDSGWNFVRGLMDMILSSTPFTTFNAQRLIKELEEQ